VCLRCKRACFVFITAAGQRKQRAPFSLSDSFRIDVERHSPLLWSVLHGTRRENMFRVCVNEPLLDAAHFGQATLHTHAHTHTCMHAHPHIHTHTDTQLPLSHTRPQTCTRTHTHSSFSHTHTHTQGAPQSKSSSQGYCSPHY